MKSILYDLYYGNIDPASFYKPKLKEHQEFLQNKRNRYDWLGRELEKDSPLLKEAFDQVLDFSIIENDWDTTDAFLQGFSIGVRMIAEAYNMELSAK